MSHGDVVNEHSRERRPGALALRRWLPLPILDAWLACRRRLSLRRSIARARAHRAAGRAVVHLLHVRKTGGTAVKIALGPFRTTDRHHVELHDHLIRLKDVPRGDGVVFFLRDPIRRFVSGFNSRLREGRPAHFSPWSPSERRAFGRFPTANDLALALSSTDPVRRRHAEEAMRGIEHLRFKYDFWLGDERELQERRADILLVGFQESLTQDFARLRGILGLPESVQLPADDAAAHRSPGGADTRLDSEAVENLRRWYASDFALIEACRRLTGA